jgi:hypothetical protein
MLVIETLKRKISDFLNSNMCVCSRLYSISYYFKQLWLARPIEFATPCFKLWKIRKSFFIMFQSKSMVPRKLKTALQNKGCSLSNWVATPYQDVMSISPDQPRSVQVISRILWNAWFNPHLNALSGRVRVSSLIFLFQNFPI